MLRNRVLHEQYTRKDRMRKEEEGGCAKQYGRKRGCAIRGKRT